MAIDGAFKQRSEATGVFQGMDTDKEYWIKNCSELVDCIPSKYNEYVGGDRGRVKC